MKIIVSHVFSNENKGDAALLSVLLSDMKKTFNNPDITILSIDKIEINETFEGFPVINSFMFHSLNRYQNLVVKFLYSFYVVGVTLFWAFVYKKTKIRISMPDHLRKLVELYSATDLIVPVGGGYMRGKPDMVSTILLMLLLHPFILSRILGKPSVVYPQSVGPFGNSIQEAMVRYVLKNVDLMFIREDISVRLLRSLGVGQNVIRTVDSGFGFHGDGKINLRSILNISNDYPIVGITVRKWLKKDGQDSYEESIAHFADHIINHYLVNVVFIPQVTAVYHRDDDREVGHRIQKTMKMKELAFVMGERYDHHTIKSIYSQVDFTVGTRFHSVIFSLTSNVPAIAIEYEHKTSGIMHDLALDEWVIKIEDLTSKKLIVLFDKLIQKSEEYSAHLKQVIPFYIRRTEEVPVLVRQVYEQHLDSGCM